MFGIPSMIRAITGTIVTVFSEADKAVTTLARSNEVWHSEVEDTLDERIRSAVYAKSVELEKEIEKSRNQLNELNPNLISKIDAKLELRFSKRNKD